jgi:hypothetical protein
MALWDRFENLVLEYMEDRVRELLTQGDVTLSPKVIAHVRETAAWAAEKAIARFQAREGVENLRQSRGSH